MPLRAHWPTGWPGVVEFSQLRTSTFGLTTTAEAMASLLHEALVELLAEHPELLIPSLQEQLGELPESAELGGRRRRWFPSRERPERW